MNVGILLPVLKGITSDKQCLILQTNGCFKRNVYIWRRVFPNYCIIITTEKSWTATSLL